MPRATSGLPYRGHVDVVELGHLGDEHRALQDAELTDDVAVGFGGDEATPGRRRLLDDEFGHRHVTVADRRIGQQPGKRPEEGEERHDPETAAQRRQYE